MAGRHRGGGGFYGVRGFYRQSVGIPLWGGMVGVVVWVLQLLSACLVKLADRGLRSVGHLFSLRLSTCK